MAKNFRPELFWMFGRYVCQLKRLSLTYCREDAGSRYMREYIKNNVTDFAKNNPEVAIYIQERTHRHPKIYATYLNGKSKAIDIKNTEVSVIADWMQRLRNDSGRDWRTERVVKTWHTENPSIQGTWNPLTNKYPMDSIQEKEQ